MERRIELKIEYTMKEYIRFIYSYFFSASILQIITIMMCLILTINFLFLNDMYLFVSSITLCLFIIIMPYVKARLFYKKIDFDNKTNKIILNEDIVFLSNELGEMKLKWNEIRKVEEYHNCYALLLGNNMAAIIPKKSFETIEMKNQFIDLIKENMLPNKILIGNRKVFRKLIINLLVLALIALISIVCALILIIKQYIVF